MRMRKQLFITCLALVIVVPMFAQDVAGRIDTLERAVTAGTASREQTLDLARLYIQASRFYEASKLAKSVIARDANDTDAVAVRDEAERGLRVVLDKKVAEAEMRARAAGATDQDQLTLADAQFEASNYTVAADLYSKLPASVVNDDVRLRHARSLAWTSRYDEAERIYADLMTRRNTPDLALEYGRVLSWMGATRPAVSTLTSVYDASQTEASAVALANARAWSGDREGALRFLNEYLEKNPNAAEARQLASELAVSPDTRLERVSRLVELFPYNLAVRLEQARLQVDAGRYGDANRTLQFIRDHSPTKIAGLDELAQTASQRREVDIARLEERRKALEIEGSMASSSQNGDEVLAVAKAYGSLGAYDKSIPLYERYLRMHSDDFTARVQYARVLSWARRYAESARVYQRLIEERPDRADLRYEYASILSWDERYGPAIREFETLTDLSQNPRAERLYSDVSSRAYYSLGQIYRWHGWNEMAFDQQNRALTLDPGYWPAREELDRVRYFRPASSIEGRYTFATNSNDFTLRRIDFNGEKWTSSRTALSFGVGRHDFEFRGDTVSANAANIGGAYRFSDRTTANARVGANFYDRGLGTRPYFGAGLNWRLSLTSRASLDFNHYDLVYDVFDFDALGTDNGTGGDFLGSPVTINDVRGHYNWNNAGRWTASADASYGFLSDDNTRAGARGTLQFALFNTPFVAIRGDARYLAHDFRSTRYWSPEDYRSLAVALQVGQNLRRLYWNAEYKVGRSYESDRSSDLRAWGAYVGVPVGEAFDIIGSYNYGRSGRFDNVLGGSGNDFINYWQRTWFVGIRLRQLTRRQDPGVDNQYYFDNRMLTTSPVLPPETH